jgi:LysM repeat protein
VLFGVAAAVALANAPAFASAAPAAQPSTRHMVVPAAARKSGAAVRSGAEVAQLLSATRPAAKHAAKRPVSYTVKSGDTLSAIAGRFYSDADYWPVLYWANHGQVQYANEIQVGQVLTVPVKPAKIPNAPTVLSPAPAPVPVPSTASTSAPADDETSGTPQSAPVTAAPVQDTSVSTAGDGSFQQCVIARESGGDSQVMNSSGHYGLYQFSSSTWAEYGGNPADFGNASVAEQNQVFNNAMAAGGQSNWSAYDGC